MKTTLLSLLLIAFIGQSLAQNVKRLEMLEDSIRKYSNIIISDFQYDNQTKANDKLEGFVFKAIQQEKSIDYTFDSIRNISFLKSDDKNIRIVSWTMPLRDGTFEYHGFSQTYNKKYKKFIYKDLDDKASHLSNPMDKRLSAQKWYGAHYYKLIQKKRPGSTTTYTLLGWKGVDRIIKQKVIEVATIKSNGDIVFGYPMFIVKGFEGILSKRPRRIIFNYSARANMHMTYETHRIKVAKKKKKKSGSSKNPTRGFGAQQKISKEDVDNKEYIKKMIIFDRLVPSSENMEGFYSYYIPATNVYDGFIYKKKKWIYFPDVDARNSSPEKPKQKIKYELFEEKDVE